MYISDIELTQKLKSLFSEERKITAQIISHIQEVDRRKLYLKLSYPSLFEYLTREIGYSASSAQRRIDAARLSHHVPETTKKLESGAISLNQVTLLQKSLRRVRKEKGQVLSIKQKQEILEKLENKSQRESEILLSQALDLPIQTIDKTHYQKDESVRVELTFTKEEIEIIEEARALLSHAVPSTGLKETLFHLAQRYIKQRNTVRAAPAVIASTTAAVVQMRQEPASDGKYKTSHRKQIPAHVRKYIFSRDKCCQFRDPQTQKICGSKYFLEIDHIHPVWDQGSNETPNLRLLCRSHNGFRYRMNQ